MHELIVLLHVVHWLRINMPTTHTRPVATREVVAACRAARLPEAVHANIAFDHAAVASPEALRQAVADAGDTLALARMTGFVFDEHGSTDRDATERAAVGLIKARMPLDDVRTHILAALARHDEQTGHVDTARRSADGPFSAWQARRESEDGPTPTRRSDDPLADVWQRRRAGDDAQ